MKSKEYENEVVQGPSGSLPLGSEIGSGAEGRVFAVNGSLSTAVKIFHEKSRGDKEKKVEAMVKPGNQPPDQTKKDENIRSIIWPQEVIRDSTTGAFLGYLMPKEDIAETDTALAYTIKELGWDSTSEPFRMGSALNLTIMVDSIHQLDHAIGDFNHENIRVHDGYIKLIDCDGFHISDGNNIYRNDTFAKRYSPPETRPKKLHDVQRADYFCLTVYIFHFLMEGEHPYRAIGPDAAGGNWRNKIEQNEFPYENPSSNIEPPDGMQQKYDRLPMEVKSKFRECFVEGKYDKNKRPDPKDWKQTLTTVTNISVDTGTGTDGSDSGTSTPVTTGPSYDELTTSTEDASRLSLSDKISTLVQSARPGVERFAYYLGWLLFLLIAIYFITVTI